MTSAVDGLKQRFMDMSQPDADGVYRNGAAKRKAGSGHGLPQTIVAGGLPDGVF